MKMLSRKTLYFFTTGGKEELTAIEDKFLSNVYTVNDLLDGSRKEDAAGSTSTNDAIEKEKLQENNRGKKPKPGKRKHSVSGKENTIPGKGAGEKRKASPVRSQKGKKTKVTGNYTCKECTTWRVILTGIMICGFMRKLLFFYGGVN